MKRLAPIVTLLASTTPAFAWYQRALMHRDFLVDAALVFAYYEKCNAGRMPADLASRARERLNMAGPSAARWSKGDVAEVIKKLGVKTFCEEYRRELATGANLVVTGGSERPSQPKANPVGFVGQTGNDWAADCRVSDKQSSRYISCLRYARGLADGFIVAQMLDEAAVTSGRVAASTASICVPKLATTDQLVEVGLRYWNAANSETRSMRAAQLLAEAWLGEWPCKRQP